VTKLTTSVHAAVKKMLINE